jgi:hypothetical protein
MIMIIIIMRSKLDQLRHRERADIIGERGGICSS